jgi:hypothetical protein
MSIDLSFGEESLKDVIDLYMDVRMQDIPGMVFGEDFEPRDFRRRLYRIVVNTLLYINSYNPSVRSVHEDKINRIKNKARGKKKLSMHDRQLIKKLEEDPYYEIGTDINITKSDIDAYREETVVHRGSGRKLTRPSITKGHWRNQPYGRGRSKRRLIWIKPYIRGRELGEVVAHHRYTAENPNIIPWWWPDEDDYDYEDDYEA